MGKKWVMLFFMVITSFGIFAENFVLNNQSSYPKIRHSMIAVQWANSAKDVVDGNQALIYGNKLNPRSLHFIDKTGKVTLKIPERAESFRVIAWLSEEGNPDYVTNWVDIVPNKIYNIENDLLIPTVLMSGTGC